VEREQARCPGVPRGSFIDACAACLGSPVCAAGGRTYETLAPLVGLAQGTAHAGPETRLRVVWGSSEAELSRVLLSSIAAVAEAVQAHPQRLRLRTGQLGGLLGHVSGCVRLSFAACRGTVASKLHRAVTGAPDNAPPRVAIVGDAHSSHGLQPRTLECVPATLAAASRWLPDLAVLLQQQPPHWTPAAASPVLFSLAWHGVAGLVLVLVRAELWRSRLGLARAVDFFSPNEYLARWVADDRLSQELSYRDSGVGRHHAGSRTRLIAVDVGEAATASHKRCIVRHELGGGQKWLVPVRFPPSPAGPGRVRLPPDTALADARVVDWEPAAGVVAAAAGAPAGAVAGAPAGAVAAARSAAPRTVVPSWLQAPPPPPTPAVGQPLCASRAGIRRHQELSDQCALPSSIAHTQVTELAPGVAPLQITFGQLSMLLRSFLHPLPDTKEFRHRPDCWLHGDVIDAWLKLVGRGAAGTVIAANTFLGAFHDQNQRFRHGRFEFWRTSFNSTRLGRQRWLDQVLFDTNTRVFFPFCVGRNHWLLVVADLRQAALFV
jgi:hypothetical protein